MAIEPPADVLPDDQTLVSRAQAGDFDALDQLVTRHERRLYALAWHLTHNHHDAQDAVQNAALAVVEHLDDFRGESSFRTWVTRVTVNHSIKLLRRRVRGRGEGQGEADSIPMPEFIADWRGDPQLALDREELRRLLDEGIAELPEGQRIVFILRDVEGLSVAETAMLAEISPANVKVRLLRARLALREYLTRRFGDERTRKTPDHEGHNHESLLAMLRARGAEGAES
jgi:RNA polymerase sigma-70 factor, ECF subfamily